MKIMTVRNLLVALLLISASTGFSKMKTSGDNTAGIHAKSLKQFKSVLSENTTVQDALKAMEMQLGKPWINFLNNKLADLKKYPYQVKAINPSQYRFTVDKTTVNFKIQKQKNNFSINNQNYVFDPQKSPLVVWAELEALLRKSTAANSTVKLFIPPAHAVVIIGATTVLVALVAAGLGYFNTTINCNTYDVWNNLCENLYSEDQFYNLLSLATKFDKQLKIVFGCSEKKVRLRKCLTKRMKEATPQKIKTLPLDIQRHYGFGKIKDKEESSQKHDVNK